MEVNNNDDSFHQDDTNTCFMKKTVLSISSDPNPRPEPAWEVLEARNPESLECHICQTHHPLSEIQKYAVLGKQAGAPTKCMKLDQKNCVARWIHPNFHFIVFRMAMKQLRLNQDCTELLKALSYRSGVLMEGSQVKRVTALPMVIGGRLLMRVQTAFVVPPHHKFESRMYLTGRNLLKCPHSRRYSFLNRSIAASIVALYAKADTFKEGHQYIPQGIECEICRTKFQVSLQRFEGKGIMLFLTKWLDLGNGLSPLESDISKVVGPSIYVPPLGWGQVSVPWQLRFEDYVLNPWSQLTSEELEEQFRVSESETVQKLRARDTLYWRFWGHRYPFLHELYGKQLPSV
jgi:hypothetical protein